MKPNRLRQLLDGGTPSIGTYVICPWPGMAEIIGNSQVFDYIEFVAEYSPLSLDQADRYLDMGVKHFCIGWDLLTLFNWCREQGALMSERNLKEIINTPETGYPAGR
ncbi:MAG: hypothetical protein JEY99_20345 [Spirochaetales bacterium]|nr:hypothetical protein [Spirochaetales bacterium]